MKKRSAKTNWTMKMIVVPVEGESKTLKNVSDPMDDGWSWHYSGNVLHHRHSDIPHFHYISVLRQYKRLDNRENTRKMFFLMNMVLGKTNFNQSSTDQTFSKNLLRVKQLERRSSFWLNSIWDLVCKLIVLHCKEWRWIFRCFYK